MQFYREVEVTKWIFGGGFQVMADVVDDVIGKCFSVPKCPAEDFLAYFSHISHCLFFWGYLIRQFVEEVFHPPFDVLSSIDSDRTQVFVGWCDGDRWVSFYCFEDGVLDCC